MKFINKHKLIIFLAILLFICTISNVVMAATKTLDQTIQSATLSESAASEFQDIGNKIFGVVQVAGIICSVGVLMILGIKYMTGSVEEKAEYKKTFGKYIVGAVLVFAIPSLAKLVYDMVKDLL